MISRTILTLTGLALMGAAAAPAQATCWFGRCGGSSSSGGHSSTSTGGSSGGSTSSSGGATQVPEPEQLALFGMGFAVLVARTWRGARRR